MDLSLSKFEDMTLYSNKNIEKLMSTLIAESSNAVLVSTYEDGAILLDHNDGQFYMCEYEFDVDKAQISFKNFDPINLKREQTAFKDTVYSFFENEEVETSTLLEDYKTTVMAQDKFVTELVNEAMSVKDFGSVLDYSQLAQLNEHELENEEFFKAYKERLSTHPSTSIKHFNWKDPVVVSLVESETVKIVNSTAKEKAVGLWKEPEFKTAFVEASKTFVEDVEEGVEKYADLFAQYPQIFSLDNADKKTLFGKILISDADLRESRNDILKGISLMFEREEAIKTLEEEYLVEGAFEDGESMDFTDDKGETKPTRKEKDEMFIGGKRDGKKAKELNDDEHDKLAAAIKKVLDKMEDESLKNKLEEVYDKLTKSKKMGTDVKTVKEAVELLSI